MDHGFPTPRQASVSVVVATHNRQERLLASLDHLQAAAPDEVIVVDNGSDSDVTSAVTTAYPQVTVHELPVNKGAAGRNVGVAAASNPLVAFADDDSWWAPGSLLRAESHFARHPNLALLAARILVGNDNRLDPVAAEMASSPLASPRALPGPPVLGFVACGAVVRRDAYLEVGGFSDLLFFLGEERLVAFDLAARGWDLAYAPDVVAHHHPGPAGHSPGRQALVARNDLLTAWMRRPLSIAVRGTAGLARRSHRDAVARRALAGALRRLPRAMRQRRRLPANVEQAARLLEDGRVGQEPSEA
jgi:N-acetylglucosaminyl-diphospho-decaprenol L-rhamnosyltransferase